MINSRIEINIRVDTLERIKQLCAERDLEASLENVGFLLDYFACVALENIKALKQEKNQDELHLRQRA